MLPGEREREEEAEDCGQTRAFATSRPAAAASSGGSPGYPSGRPSSAQN